MMNGRGNERRRARRIKVELGIKIAKTLSKSKGAREEEWVEMASLINISHLGAYFEYGGPKRLDPGDILRIELDVSLPFENRDMDSGERLPMGGLAAIVHSRPGASGASMGVGVGFLEPLSMKLNSA